MGEPWYTEEGASGVATIEYRDSDWYLVEPAPPTDVKTNPRADGELDPDESPIRISGTVSKFMYGTGGDANYVSLSNVDVGVSKDAGESSTAEEPGSAYTEASAGRPDESRPLSEFNGTDEYVTVTATVDTVYYVNKDESGVPDIKGELTDDSLLGGVTFVVADGVSHPYLGEGERYEFRGVKDHYYAENAEVQVLITDQTEFAGPTQAE